MKLSLFTLFFGFIFLNSVSFAQFPGSDLEFILLKPFNNRTNSGWGPVLKDIVNHEAPGDHNSFSDKITLGHETTHGINAYVRNKLGSSGKKANGFYLLTNRAVVLEEPNIRKSRVAAFVPSSLRGSRYSTYITGQKAWDDRPLYIFDEWVAYINGAETGVDLVEKGLWNSGWRDGVAGELEFAVYAIATAMAVEAGDRNYFDNNFQFTEFIAFNLERTMESYKKGSVMKDFKYDVQEKFLANLRTSPDASALREFTKKLWGDSWVNEIFGY